jgi:hypothetical protein
MRDLNECQAEVFRRSEERIKERKQRRKHIMLACIPLVLCITLFAAFFPWDTKTAAPEEPAVNKAPMDGPAGNWDGSSNLSVLRIDVSGLDFSKTYTDTVDIMLIWEQLCSYGQSEPECYEEPTEGVLDGECKENTGRDDQESIIADSITGGALKEEAPGENYNGSSDNDDIYGVTSDSTNIGYTITLTTDAGTQMEYYLSGNILENRTTNQSRKLTQSEANILKELLGIPNP